MAERVLIVEDEPSVATELQRQLVSRGYRADCLAGSIEEALRVIQEGTFDLAILDVSLRGERVWPVAWTLRRKGVPFVFLSAYGRQLQVPNGMGEAPLLDKPVALDELECALMGLTLPDAKTS